MADVDQLGTFQLITPPNPSHSGRNCTFRSFPDADVRGGPIAVDILGRGAMVTSYPLHTREDIGR